MVAWITVLTVEVVKSSQVGDIYFEGRTDSNN